MSNPARQVWNGLRWWFRGPHVLRGVAFMALGVCFSLMMTVSQIFGAMEHTKQIPAGVSALVWQLALLAYVPVIGPPFVRLIAPKA